MALLAIEEPAQIHTSLVGSGQELSPLHLIQAIPKGMEEIERGLAHAHEPQHCQGPTQPGEDQQHQAERQAYDRALLSGGPDRLANGADLGGTVDHAALAQGLGAQGGEQSLVAGIDDHPTEGGFQDELTAIDGAAIGIDIDRGQASAGRGFPDLGCGSCAVRHCEL